MDDEKYIKERLSNAIEIMRNACDQAERDIKDHKKVKELPSYVLHKLCWGMANASSSIETAMSHVTRMFEFLELDKMELEKKYLEIQLKDKEQ